MSCSDDEDVYQGDNLELNTGFGNVIIVDNLPVVTREKFGKLETVVRKIYSQIGMIKEDGLWMPVEYDPESKSEKTLGYCFIEFNTPLVPPSLSLALSLSSQCCDLEKEFFVCLKVFQIFVL